MSYVSNPFINTKSILNYNDNGIIIKLEQENIAKYYKDVYILVKKNDLPIPVDFYNLELNKDIFDDVCSNLIIRKTTVKLLKNKNHFDNCVIMSNEQLQQFNIFNYKLDNNNIVVPILNITFQNISQYIEQYEPANTLEKIYNTKLLNCYFETEPTNIKINDYLSNCIDNMDESFYWTYNYNCLINSSEKFKNRIINVNINKLTDKKCVSIIEKIRKTTQINTNNDNYLSELANIKPKINDTSNKEKFTNLISTVNNSGFSSYKITNSTEFTCNDINKLFDTLNEKQQFLLFSNLMISKKYCHLVVNNKYILQLMTPQINKFSQLFRYLLSYAWIRFYMDECIKQTWLKKTDDCVFDIDTASLLPVYPFNYCFPKTNPYMPIFVSDDELNPENNIISIPDYGSVLGEQGICNLKEFKIRMNIFCTGNQNNDLFDGFDFIKHKVALSGSLITACIQKNHPLMSRFKSKSFEEKFNNYFNEYYSNSDIDTIVISNNEFQFIDVVREFYNNIIINLCKYNSSTEPKHIKLEYIKSASVFVDEDFINKNIVFNKLIKNKLEFVINNLDKNIVINKFKPYYEKLKDKEVEKIINEYGEDEFNKLKLKYPEAFDFDNVIIKIYLNKTPIKENMMTLSFSNKFKITSPYLNHNIEIFPIKYDDFFSIVSSFHLPCVRGYYNGENVYLTPSCISAHLTYMNIDYKYFAGTKDPIEIINKYRMRGFGTWLNSTEKDIFIKYSSNVNFWKNLYSLNSQNINTNICGHVNINHKLFRPRLYNIDAFIDSPHFVDTTDRYLNDNVESINMLIPITQTIAQKFNSISFAELNYKLFNSIDKAGNIIPLKKWIILYTWNIYESFYKDSIPNVPNDTLINTESNKNKGKPKISKK